MGVDEAGRGPLAGPVAVGAVLAPEGLNLLSEFPGLNDSKKLSEAVRERLFALLCAHPEVLYRVSFARAGTIDRQGIVRAVRTGVYRSVRALASSDETGKVWLDGSLAAPSGYEQETVVGGDGLVPAIMLASVAAKVMRDRHMERLAKRYPGYGFEQHKGYGTQAHRDAIAMLGPCFEHRRTFGELK